MRSLYIFSLVFLLYTIVPTAYAETFIGQAIGVHDGDTITVLDDAKHQTKVRLAEIDAPELKQPYGSKSKKMLSDLVFGKTVTVAKGDIDKYGRTVGRVYQGNTDVNLAMVRQGGAWAYRQYLTDDAIPAAEESAKADRAGLWGLQEDQRMPPWEWRHGGKQSSSIEVSQENVRNILPSPVKRDAPFACAGKTVCGQMVSCAEAKFYLTECGLSRLDGDKDGVPCEKLCR